MHLCVVTGSHRQKSQSARVGSYLKERLTHRNKVSVVTELSLAQEALPLWDEEFPNGDKWKSRWEPVARTLQESHGFVFVVPEWGGMVPPAFKNFLLLCSSSPGALLGHKPALLVGISASVNGAYPMAELRMSGYKNTHVCYLPNHILVRHCEQMFQGPEPANDADRYLRKRTENALDVLVAYTTALQTMRQGEPEELWNTYPYGM